MSIQYTGTGSNPRPLKHESSPITTRPGLQPAVFPLVIFQFEKQFVDYNEGISSMIDQMAH